MSLVGQIYSGDRATSRNFAIHNASAFERRDACLGFNCDLITLQRGDRSLFRLTMRRETIGNAARLVRFLDTTLLRISCCNNETIRCSSLR